MHVDWTHDLNDQIRRDYVGRDAFNALMSRIGVTPRHHVVFYGDRNNWWACYAFWVFQLFGHTSAKVMDGGRLKWEKENRPLTRDVPHYAADSYEAPERRTRQSARSGRKCSRTCRRTASSSTCAAPRNTAGTRLHMPEYPNEGAMRGGHIPGAKSIPWARAVNPDDGTFKSADELRALYMEQKGSSRQRDHRLLPYRRAQQPHLVRAEVPARVPNVRNYDGSWTEWGNLVGVPIEK